MSLEQADAIRDRMARIRHELDQDVDAVVEQAKELTDWRSFVRRHGLMCISAAAALGFLLVPSRVRVMSPSAEELEKLAKRNRLVVKPAAAGQRSNIVSPLMNLMAGVALRTAFNAAGEQVNKYMQQRQPAAPADVDENQEHPC